MPMYLTRSPPASSMVSPSMTRATRAVWPARGRQLARRKSRRRERSGRRKGRVFKEQALLGFHFREDKQADDSGQEDPIPLLDGLVTLFFQNRNQLLRFRLRYSTFL